MERKVNETNFIVSKTNLKGQITYINKDFIKFSEFSEDELLGKPHNIIRHSDMPKEVFFLLWNTISSGNDFFGFVKNKTKEDNFYWVWVFVSPDFDSKGNIIGYTSFRKKPNINAIPIISDLYSNILNDENRNFYSSNVLTNFLQKNNISYEEFVNNLQNKGKI